MFMQSNGGLTDAHRFQGKDSILSGPAGGIVGMVRTSEAAGFDKVIGFDMGGTSTDVSHYAGELEREFETQVAGVRMRAPMMSIHTIAAGGGSILHLRRPAPARRARFRGREPGARVLPPRRPAHRHRLQRDAGQDPAGVLSRRCSAPRGDEALDAGGGARASSSTLAAEIETRHGQGSNRPRRPPRDSCASPWPTWPTRSSSSRCSAATT